MGIGISLSADVTVTEIDGRAVLFSKKTGDFFGLNASAAELLKALQHQPLEVVAREAAERYGVAESEVTSDLTSLVDNLASRKLITVNPAGNDSRPN